MQQQVVLWKIFNEVTMKFININKGTWNRENLLI